jgi:hypothetical protein
LRALSLALGALVASLAVGCGAAGRAQTHTARPPSIPGIDTSISPMKERGTIVTSTIPPGQKFRGDGDADNPGDIDGNGDIDPEDHDSDYPVPSSYRLPDEDDRPVFSYGRAPRAGDRAAIAAAIERYYSTAAAGNGNGACLQLLPSLAAAVPSTYGQAGPHYLRGEKTCAAILSTLFSHFHGELSEPVDIVAIRVKGAAAKVVLSSRKMRANSILLEHRGGAWRMQQMLGQPLP